MKENWKTRVVTEHLVLLPYQKAFVPKYHAWMEDAWLREMTASERLSIEEEYANQASWRDDAQKCTFIVFHRASLEAAEASGGDITAAMCGDVNLFLLDDDASEDYAPQAVEAGAGAAAQVPKAAEVMVMIAEPDHRQKGYAREAVLALMSYGQSALGLKRFVAKITDTNAASIRLFQKLGFREAKRLAVFSEVHFALDVEPGMLPADVAARVAAYDNPEV